MRYAGSLQLSRNAPGETTPCAVEGCAEDSKSRGWCEVHYRRWRRTGDPTKLTRAEAGSVVIKKSGYAVVNGRMHHRVVMEQVIGRPLLAHENVHHRNGVRHDNRPENLELWSSMQPSGQHVTDKVRWAREVLALYGDLVDRMDI